MAQIIDPNEMFFTPFEPKQANRFILYLEGVPAYLIRKASRPSIAMGTVEMPHINVSHKVKGKATWQDIQIELYDPIVPSAAQAAMAAVADDRCVARAADLGALVGPVGHIVLPAQRHKRW